MSMQAKFQHAGVAGNGMILIEHRGETLEFSGSVYGQAFKKGTYEPFQQINKYWSRIDIELQDKIFDLYRQAKIVFNETFNVNPLILQLRPIVNEIIDLHDTEDFERWTRYHAGIWIPEDLDAEYKFSHEKPGSREQTYLITDYWELVYMVIKLRSIAPIWGEFAEITKKESGPTFRDLNAYFTISKSSIAESPAMQRLNHYVAKNVKQDDINIRASIDGIGSDVFQTNLVANILVRFLVIASFTRQPSDTHLVQIIHKTLRNRLSQNESHQNAILEKINPNEDDSSEDSSSRAEKYKNKPLVPPGEFTAIEKWTEYYREIAARLLLKNELSEEEIAELDRAMEAADAMSSHTLEECQIRIIQWVVSPIVSARSMWDINKSSILRLAGIAQFVLWNTDFKDLAGIPTARSMNAEGYGSYSSESRAHITKDKIDKLNELYPYYRRHPTKKAVKPNNDAVNEIMDLAQQLSDHTWFLNMAEEQIAELRGSAANKTHRVGYDIRNRLADYAIYMQLRNAQFISLYTF
ncbi:hypothetical protein [Ralstonia phage RSF1]|uniref:Uncharacterized protein n=1 Tax=Ralstonia phage RSF1 TaxID=1689679 RepID=A0A0K2QRM1_9CAUD|nr:hypothetical protein AVU11_gp219 [Ralstonia phage RSF1]BAS05011.2 hypothetical protein [Ralstonia phage RSF1]